MVNEFQQLLDDTCERQGWLIPKPARVYIAGLLAERVSRVPWEPQPSYAEQYLQLTTTSAALELGNTCFWCRSVFPHWGERRGLNPSYLEDMGRGCYDRVLREREIPAVKLLRDHWEFLAEVTWTAVHCQDGFRSMWD